ncbi:hypothetical protein [Aquimarina agarilytica]|uniref:hypothetical protein n=1 Tax=Aquimarina agarilytica TaxID=1087449 RepID=UPI00028A0A7F|nr:hypothetical protein [Aquimarina agarilytica]
MSPKSSTISLSILSSVLAILLLGLAAYTYNDYKQHLLNNEDLAKEKLAMESELSLLVEKYENVQALNSVMDNHLIESKKRIVRLLDTIRSNEPKLQLLIKFRREISALKEEKLRLFHINDSLARENDLIKGNLNKTANALNQSKNLQKKLSKENTKLTSIVHKKKELAFANLKGEAVRVKGNREYGTKKAKKAQRIKICFTIMDNIYSIREDKLVYLKLLNPNNVLLGDFVQEDFQGDVIAYSSKQFVPYKNEQVDHCVSIKIDTRYLTYGTYTLQLFSAEHELKKTTTFRLD